MKGRIITSSGKVINHIVILYGGFSHEANFTAHEAVNEVLKGLEIKTSLIDVREKDFVKRLLELNADVAFITNQGAYGEDGKLQGLLELIDLPYVGSGVCASAVGMNKLAAKLYFKSLNLRVADYYYVPLGHLPDYGVVENQVGLPMIVKPIMTNGSFGIELVNSKEEFDSAIKTLSEEYGDLIVEEYLDGQGKEYAAGVIEDDLNSYDLPVYEIDHGKKVFDHITKYTRTHVKQTVPADIPDTLSMEMKTMARKVHYMMGCSGMSRIDTIIAGGKIYLVEVNTLPGFLPMSTFPKQCKVYGFSYEEIVVMLLKNAFKRRPMEIAKLRDNYPIPPEG